MPVGESTGDEVREEALRPGCRFGRVDDPFELGEEIGSGAAARVYTCKRVSTGEMLAAKVINLQRLRLLGDFEQSLVKMNREVDILRNLHHPRIVNLQEVHKTRNWVFLVMELVRGGELFDQIVQNRTLNEIEAKYIFRQLLEGVGYMHTKNVIHRDLKPENILISSSKSLEPPLSGKLHDVKIADFGLSKVISEGVSFAKTFVGTPQYWAPEVLNVQRGGESYTKAVDFWSLGAVLFVMLGGRYPFDGKQMPLEEQIQKAAFTMTSAAWEKVSQDAKDVVKGLLRVNPQDRFKLEDCLSHPWLANSSLFPAAKGVILTEVSAGQEDRNAVSGAVPLVTQPSATSSFSGSARSQEERETDSFTGPNSGRDAGEKTFATTQDSQETIFCLNELLKLQVSIAGSLEMACLAFRHADLELSDAIRKTFRQARDLSSLACNAVSKYAQVAQQVSQIVMPDLKLAVEEKEPSLAVSLLGMVKGWVASMKEDGEEIQRHYLGLQESVHNLIKRAQHTKLNADRRLQEAVQVVESELVAQMSPRGVEGIRAIDDRIEQDAQCSRPSFDAPMPAAITDADGQESITSKAALNVPLSMNVWTRQLFEQLSHVQERVGGKDALPPVDRDQSMSSDGEGVRGPAVTSGKAQPLSAAGRGEQEEEVWKKDVLELLFMAPGAVPTLLPKIEAFSFHPDVRPTAATSSEPRATEVTSPDGKSTVTSPQATFGRPGTESAAEAEAPDVIVRYVPSPAAAAQTAEALTHSSASLLRALRELKRVDEILHGCSAFWANMDGTVQKLAQMKEHTECLVRFAANSKPLKERFDQRLGEYITFWSSLERLCRQYCLDHQSSSKRMYEVIREVADAADVIDTAQSARMGVILAMREKQRRSCA